MKLPGFDGQLVSRLLPLPWLRAGAAPVDTLPMTSADKITSLELGRLLAILFVVVIHARPLLLNPVIDGEQHWLGDALNQLGRFAVPLFFLLAGYFIQPRLTASPLSTFSRYASPLLKVWLAWSLVYLLAPFNFTVLLEQGYLAERMGYWGYLETRSFNALLEGGAEHLWFLPSLVMSVGIIALLLRYRVLVLLLPLAGLLYGAGLVLGSYQSLFALEPGMLSRNGPFFSTVMVVIGFELRRGGWRLSTPAALLLMLAGMALHFTEAWLLLGTGVTFSTHDFLLGTPLWVTGLFLLMLNFPRLGQGDGVQSWSADILGVYLCHMLVIFYLGNLLQLFDTAKPIYDLVIVPATLVLAFLLARAIRRSPLQSLLLR